MVVPNILNTIFALRSHSVCCQVSRVNSILQNKEQGLGSATGMINQLKDANAQLQQQVEKARADHKEEKARASSLQVTCAVYFPV